MWKFFLRALFERLAALVLGRRYRGCFTVFVETLNWREFCINRHHYFSSSSLPWRLRKGPIPGQVVTEDKPIPITIANKITHQVESVDVVGVEAREHMAVWVRIRPVGKNSPVLKNHTGKNAFRRIYLRKRVLENTAGGATKLITYDYVDEHSM